jgi:hypothetical protein
VVPRALEPLVLGGSAWPIGWSAGFIAAPLDALWPVVLAWQSGIGAEHEESSLPNLSLAEQLRRLEPLEMPYTRRLLVRTDSAWTAYFDNHRLGGDPFPWVGYLSDQLDCRGVIAVHVPRGQRAHAATKFELFGPEGKPPLRYVRTIHAGLYEDGRWEFDAAGAVQPFEETASYGARLVRDRFTRDMLVRYLEALGIRVDEPAYYRDGLLVQKIVDYPTSTWTVDEAREEYLHEQQAGPR